jgi:hypothetical protein
MNVVSVDPKELGFRKNLDVMSIAVRSGKTRKIKQPQLHDVRSMLSTYIAAIRSKLSFLKQILSTRPNVKRKRLTFWALGIIPVILVFSWYVFVWILPHASVTILALPNKQSGDFDVTINLSTETLDAESGVIPGSKREQSQTGETTIAVTGTKEVGESAKGSVTIYNKTLEKRVFKKGTTLISGSLEFTLDDDVTIASASETIGSITFGKGAVAITASRIGPQSNLSANSEFLFKGLSSSIAIARNDSALLGGTSRKVSVVSREDQNTLVDTLTKDLVEKAKTELMQNVSGGEVLIDETIETNITEKKFNQELNQETEQLSGSITVTISGVTFKKEDIDTYVMKKTEHSVTEGYVLDPEKIIGEVKNLNVVKGNISGLVHYSITSIPSFDLMSIKEKLAGKTRQESQEYLRTLIGIAGVDFRSRYTFDTNRLPRNSNNISIIIQLQE